MIKYSQVVLRLIISLVLSALIGIDRETTKKPAGIRTHILVSTGSTLVMLLSLYIYQAYGSKTNIQPDRLGAQVISGMGFLGAGTILREGNTVKGLTTAASLWVVACIGLSVGAGFYFAAILATVLVLVTLIYFPIVSNKIRYKGNLVSIKIISLNKPGQLGKIANVIGDLGLNIIYMDLEIRENDVATINLDIDSKNSIKRIELLNSIADIDNIIEVSQKFKGGKAKKDANEEKIGSGFK